MATPAPVPQPRALGNLSVAECLVNGASIGSLFGITGLALGIAVGIALGLEFGRDEGREESSVDGVIGVRELKNQVS